MLQWLPNSHSKWPQTNSREKIKIRNCSNLEDGLYPETRTHTLLINWPAGLLDSLFSCFSFLCCNGPISGFPADLVVKNKQTNKQKKKNPPANAGDASSIPGWGGSPREGNSNPLQYSCLENPHGQGNLKGCSPWGCKESDMTQRLNNNRDQFLISKIMKNFFQLDLKKILLPVIDDQTNVLIHGHFPRNWTIFHKEGLYVDSCGLNVNTYG